MSDINKNVKPGQLFVIATPIGNLEDLSFRAVRILKEVDLIAAEDTRHSRHLLQHFAITTPLTAYHDFNEAVKAEQLIQQLHAGKSIALISDAGTPLISDPGFALIKNAWEQQLSVVPVPGACAAIAALSVAGIASDRFIFEGFLPAKTKARKDRLQALAVEPRTLIFYEAPHRLLDTLTDMQAVWGDQRSMVIAKELTKMHEKFYRGHAQDLKDYFARHTQHCKGEFVILAEGVPEQKQTGTYTLNTQTLLLKLLETLPLKQAVNIAAGLTGQRKNDLYSQALSLMSNE